MGRLDEAAETVQSSIDMSSQIGEQRLLGWLTSLHAIIYADLGEMETARELAELGLEKNRDLGQVVMQSWSINVLAHVLRGEVENQRILDLCKKLGRRSTRPIMSSQGYIWGSRISLLF